MPGVPTNVQTSTSGADVVISWTTPTSTGGTGIALTGYVIEVLTSDGVTYQGIPSTECDGTDSTVISGASCLTIDMLIFS